MDYTTQKPTVPGFYWNRQTKPGEPGEDWMYMIMPDVFEGDEPPTFESRGPYWAGPILPPTTYTGPIGGGVALGIDPTDEDRHCLDTNDLR